jgi:NAD(P)-dependent dehydrogenase (short-subunit alcohol dehydrogenase family)
VCQNRPSAERSINGLRELLPRCAEGDMRKWIESTAPLGRIGQVGEIAPAVSFLASDDASYLTGETIHVSGGLR